MRPRTLRARAAAAGLLAVSLAAAMTGGAAGVAGDAGAAGVAAVAGPATASAWSIQAVPPLDTTSTISRFLGVSCPAGGACVAVGRSIVAAPGPQSGALRSSPVKLVVSTNRAARGEPMVMLLLASAEG